MVGEGYAIECIAALIAGRARGDSAAGGQLPLEREPLFHCSSFVTGGAS